MSLVKSEIETLQDENNQLRAEISRLEACRVAAATWLTLYDGGKDDSKETLLEHIHKAESILDDADKKERIISISLNCLMSGSKFNVIIVQRNI